MRIDNYEERVEFPQEVTYSLDGPIVIVKGPKGTVRRSFHCPGMFVVQENNTLLFRIPLLNKRKKTMLGTFRAHLHNMIEGVLRPYTYKLKVCSGHFPMNVTTTKTEITIKNFVGEKIPRTLRLKQGVAIKVEGDVIVVESCDRDLAGQTAASIEQLTKRPGYDPRVFQHGCYIFEKAGKELK